MHTEKTLNFLMNLLPLNIMIIMILCALSTATYRKQHFRSVNIYKIKTFILNL